MKINRFELYSISLAKFIGVFYLIIIVCGLFSGIAVRGTIVIPDNPLATLLQIMEKESLFRIGFLLDTVMVLSDIVVSILS